MDYKKSKAPVNTVTRNIMDLCDQTGSIYESVAWQPRSSLRVTFTSATRHRTTIKSRRNDTT